MSKIITPWDDIFKRKGRVFTRPHPDMPGLVQLLRTRKACRILDLGSGSGRHVIYLARHGFSTYGLDRSPTGIELTAQWLAQEGLSANLLLHDMTHGLPYANAVFDAVISIQVMHHADLTTIQGIIAEITRVLTDSGLVFVTVPRLKNQGRTFKQIEPHTFVPLDGPEQGLPHHYFTPKELQRLFAAYEVTDIHLDDIDHYCMSAFKVTPAHLTTPVC